MAIIEGLEYTFDTVAKTYEKMRPGYVTELYEMLFQYLPLGSGSNVLEIGIGGGQATLPVLETGCSLTAVEYGTHFSQLCREKFADYPQFSVITGKFEETDMETDSFDLIFSASAFHWVTEEVGYQKVYSLLKNGGAFARFANHPHPDKGRPIMTDEIEDLYAEYYCRFHNRPREKHEDYSEVQAKDRAMIAAKYGFTDIRYALFERTRTFTASEYRTLLGTYSDHIAIEETIRNVFFSKVEEAINDHGGFITIYDIIDLQLARKL